MRKREWGKLKQVRNERGIVREREKRGATIKQVLRRKRSKKRKWVLVNWASSWRTWKTAFV